MYRHDRQHLEFVSQFVDSVTVRPFFEDLRQLKRISAMMGRLPRAEPSGEDRSSTAAA
ncbi:hypothetical protein ENSA5_14880 [Enhygromyxa salina]|uniref:Uncharacterized protein n=2 Tax=Enhygromyxa salina TaxID=215803 RepID=A0A2S9YEW4_9BACT|nr:hypothetical protein ENSA5_14880 [Enhygromyxa salina]